MAKRCKVCKKSYPDELDGCPYCAEVVDLDPTAEGADDSSAVVRLRDPGAAPDEPMAMSDSDIDLQLGAVGDEPSGVPASGTSAVDWGTLAKPGGGLPGSSGDIQIDAPSDKDILRQAPSSKKKGTSEEAGSSGDIDLFPEDKTAAGGPAVGPASGTSSVHWDSLVRPGDPKDPESQSGVRIDAASDADILLHAETDEDRSGPPMDLEEPLGVDSDPDLLGADDPALEVAETASGRDLGMKTPDSGLDLDQLTGGVGPPSSGVAILDEPVDLAGPASGESSAVDLGSLQREGKSPSGAASDVAAEILGLGSDSGRGTADSGAPLSLGESPSSVKLTTAESASGTGLGADEAVDETAVAEEEGIEEPAAAREKPAKKEPKRARTGTAWVGGGVLGALVGAGACFGLWMGGVEPPPEWRGSSPPPKGSIQAQPTGVQASLAQLRAGDIEKALPGLQQAGEDPAQLAARGEARWLSYLRQQATAGQPIQADAPPIKEAIDDLKKANNADALFWLGHIQEQTGNPAEALKTYQEAINRFKDPPAVQRRFQAALHRLETRGPAGGPVSRLPIEALDEGLRLALMLLALQAPAEAGADKAPADDEAGYYFWEAVRLAQAGDYARADALLEKARTTHYRQRFVRLRKAQNPLSDPTEEVFLRTCAELKTYWLMRAQLKEKGYLDPGMGGDPLKSIAAVLKDATTLKAEADKLKEEKAAIAKKATELDVQAKEALKAAADAKKVGDEAAKNVIDLGDKLKTASEQLKTADGKLKAVTIRLEAAGIKQDEVAKGVDALAAARDAASATLDEVMKKLREAKFLPADAKPAELARGVESLIETARLKDPAGRLTTAQAEIKRYQAQLAQRRASQELLDLWLTLLQDRGRKDLAEGALVDVDRVNRDSEANAEARAKAHCVRGLALRNLGKIAEAQTALEESIKAAEKPGGWYQHAVKALAELKDPIAYYLPRAEQLHQAGQHQAALDLLKEGLEVFPKDNGRLLALRSLARLELARQKAKGKLAAADPEVVEAGQDAQAAIKAGAPAEGHYAEGRLAEELGNWADARRNYEEAVKAEKEDSAEANRYRLALARVLLRMHQDRIAVPGGNRLGRRPATEDKLREALALLVIFAQPGGLPGQPPEVEQAMRLADQVLASKNATFTARARALAIKGLWTQALQEFVDGLRPQLPRDQADALADLVRNHPALKRPDSLGVADPLRAEEHFATGLRHYWGRRYGPAEKEFLAAVENDGLDARYFYFLGLSRLPQNKRDEAFEDFEQGSRLEQQGRPARPAVNASLERVQGSPRQTINRFRP